MIETKQEYKDKNIISATPYSNGITFPLNHEFNLFLHRNKLCLNYNYDIQQPGGKRMQVSDFNGKMVQIMKTIHWPQAAPVENHSEGFPV